MVTPASHQLDSAKMTPDVIATVLTGAAVLVGVWRLVENVRRDLTAQIAAVNQRIDNVLLADRERGLERS